MVDGNQGLPDLTWIDHGEWHRCNQNPHARELVVGQAVRINFQDPYELATHQAGEIIRVRVINNMGQADVRWVDPFGQDVVRTVPVWALVKA